MKAGELAALRTVYVAAWKLAIWEGVCSRTSGKDHAEALRGFAQAKAELYQALKDAEGVVDADR